MSLPENRYVANERECAAKVIDGEAVIINLLNGTYYGLDKAGGAMWEMLAASYTTTEVVTAIVARYGVHDGVVHADLEQLMKELQQEQLLVAAPTGTVATSVTVVAATASEAYEKPVLTTYRDMADLLALDPPMPRLEDIVWSETNSKQSDAQ